jgi:Mn2+/Fe2+ NRAMP family transporter
MAVFIPLGGIVSLAIMATGAPYAGTVEPTGDIRQFAMLLTPAAGAASGALFGIGLLSAGLTSAITAPMAVAEGIGELLGWAKEEHGFRYRMLWLSVLAFGLCFSLLGLSPLSLIVAAQAAN